MNRKQKGIYAAAAFCMAILIFDCEQALRAASEGLELCLRTAIPSLFPFFVLSGILVSGISELRIPALAGFLRVPSGWESIFLLGCIGGYPVGAQCVAQAYRSEQLSKEQAQRMLGFCTNCGPAFLFGVVGPMFPHPGYPAVIMATGILSAMIVGHLWPGSDHNPKQAPAVTPISLPKAVRQAISSMASVCAWIILGKIVLHYLDQQLLRYLSQPIDLLTAGFLELTNGCLGLSSITDLPCRFVTACAIISFGGLCVAMQVSAICAENDLSFQYYLPQKLLQAVIAALLAMTISIRSIYAIPLIFAVLWLLYKSAVAFQKNMMYNADCKGGFHHAVPKKD